MLDFHHYNGKLSTFISIVVDFIAGSPGGMMNIQTVFDLYPLGFGTCCQLLKPQYPICGH
jgi:hypothetical protein